MEKADARIIWDRVQGIDKRVIALLDENKILHKKLNIMYLLFFIILVILVLWTQVFLPYGWVHVDISFFSLVFTT